MVKTYQLEWRLLGPLEHGEIPGLERGWIQDTYKHGMHTWTEPVRGGAIHIKHFFGFDGHLKAFEKDRQVVWANTYIYSDKDQVVDAWINFNTTSTSDNRAGVAQTGHWNANQQCNVWINDERIDPPAWQHPGVQGKEFAFTDEIYTSRTPTRIRLREGWNKVLIKTAPSWKWVFSFSPIIWDGSTVREVDGLKYAATAPIE
jgi:hypothetical protein